MTRSDFEAIAFATCVKERGEKIAHVVKKATIYYQLEDHTNLNFVHFYLEKLPGTKCLNKCC